MNDLTGSRPVVFTPPSTDRWNAIQVPCGQCIGCRLDKSRDWAIRCVHEAKLHDRNCFITLTFNDEALKDRGHSSVAVRDMQLFLKRLRKKSSVKIRVFYCGEYGDILGRPHYHACLFNWDFEDKKRWRKNGRGDVIYRSELLAQLWPFGFSSVGALTWESAAYVARYLIKKQVGKAARNGCSMSTAVLNYRTGRIEPRSQEFARMSRGGRTPQGENQGGIGRLWADRYQKDWYRIDGCVHEGRRLRLPRYYDSRYELVDREHLEEVKAKRVGKAEEHAYDQTEERLRAREMVKKSKMGRLVRSLE